MELIRPDWPAGKRVKAISTTRIGGNSLPPYDSLNLGQHVGDDRLTVESNRDTLRKTASMPSAPHWLNQIHGTHVVTLTCEGNSVPDADAAYTQVPEVVCAIMTADCLPVLFCNQEGTEVAAAHAGWRGLLDGVIENTVAKFSKPSGVMAWLGPAIGPSVFEVGSEVREQFMSFSECAEQAFKPYGTKWLADIHLLARQRLSAIGVESVYGDSACTFSEPDRFFSYRRDQQTGRQASFIWLED